MTVEQPSKFYKNHKLSVCIILASWLSLNTILIIYVKSKLAANLISSTKVEATLGQILEESRCFVSDFGFSNVNQIHIKEYLYEERYMLDKYVYI